MASESTCLGLTVDVLGEFGLHPRKEEVGDDPAHVILSGPSLGVDCEKAERDAADALGDELEPDGELVAKDEVDASADEADDFPTVEVLEAVQLVCCNKRQRVRRSWLWRAHL